MFPTLQCLFYSEFDTALGPIVLYQVPEGFLTSNASIHLHKQDSNTSLAISQEELGLEFDSISEYIIPKPELCGKLVSLCYGSWKIMGFPISLVNSIYERNNFVFNLCFVFDRNAQTSCYEQVVRKMSRELQMMETEWHLIYNKESKSRLLNLMEELFHDLNTYNECQIHMTNTNVINVKLFPDYKQPNRVQDYQVPILITHLVVQKTWDLSIQKILPFINGVYHVKKISEIADVDIGLTRLAVQHLLYYNCIQMIDIFQFSNSYTVNRNVMQLLHSESIQEECCDFVSRFESHRLEFTSIFTLYCSLKGGMSLRQWIEENSQGIPLLDPRKFIVFGVVKGFVERIHRYPIYHSSHSIENSSHSSHSTHAQSMENNPRQEIIFKIKKYLNGKHHYDELCSRFGCSVRELEEILHSDPCIQIVYK